MFFIKEITNQKYLFFKSNLYEIKIMKIKKKNPKKIIENSKKISSMIFKK